MTNKLEKGGSLQELADFARNWFNEHGVEMPLVAKDWQGCSVRRGELPPGCTTASLRKKGISALNFIKMIQGRETSTRHKNDPITKTNCFERTGLKWLSCRVVNKHKRIMTKCSVCHREEELDYGTVQRMVVANNRLCHYCRDAGGKRKDLNTYSIEGFRTLGRFNAGRVTLECLVCLGQIERGISYVKQAEYLVCEHCHPEVIMGTKMETRHGAFDSKIEYLVYEKLLEYMPATDVYRQVSYNELFSTGTKHTADFYIPKIDLVLEITTRGVHMKELHSYRKTHDWKLSVSDKIKFAYSIKQAEDIVRAALDRAVC